MEKLDVPSADILKKIVDVNYPNYISEMAKYGWKTLVRVSNDEG
jgi:hypothetical protein